MSWGVKYRCQFYDFQNQRLSKVDILEDGYASSITTLTGFQNPFSLSYNADAWINGSEAIFSFIATQANASTYDGEFLADDYRAKKLKYYADGTNLTWCGWLKPENASRSYHDLKPVYQLSATDGIGDLSDIDYLNSGVSYSDKIDLLSTIKRALNLIGIDDLDFFTQCNTYETILLTSSDNPFKYVTH